MQEKHKTDYHTFCYKCGYCGAELEKVRPADLKNCAVQCTCGTFLKKDSYHSTK